MGEICLVGVLREWITLRQNFRLKGYVSRQNLWTVRLGNGYTTTLTLEVFTQINFVADFIRLKIKFVKKTTKSLFEPPFEDLNGNVRTPSIARSKARGRLYIRHNWTFLLSLAVETLQAEICRSRRFSRGWVTLSANFRRRGIAHQSLLVSENKSDCLFVQYQNIRSALIGFVTKQTCDGRTDRYYDI